MAEDQAIPQLVVIGSSAGGIDALSMLVSTLPSDFPAPIVIAQHLDPARASHLGDILGRKAALAVKTVLAAEPLEPGVIYVVPSNRFVHVTDHQVTVSEDGEAGPKPSVDVLFDSAAKAYGEGLVAVILTGGGSDGAAGARHVTAAGGTVVIQNPETASFPSMPRSLSPTTVDIVADIEQMGPVLHQLVTGSYAARLPPEDRLFDRFLNDLRDESGVDFRGYKRPTILRRLQRRMTATSTRSLSEYVRYLGDHPEEYQRLISTFLIKVTGFFRDEALFDYLRETAIPRLVAEAPAHDDELRFWSAGCATGEEAYSLAILLAEVLGNRAARTQVRIFATDLDPAAIAFARRGVYPASALSNVPPDLVERHFVRLDDGEYEVGKPLRLMTVFGEHDLTHRAPFPRIDLALCRNVLIYFTPELQRRALQLFAFALRDGGLLALGKAESTSLMPDLFVLESATLKVYRRRGERILVPPAHRPALGAGEGHLQTVARARRAGGTAPPGEQNVPRPVTEHLGSERAGAILLRLPIGVVVVDKSYDVQLINPEARNILAIHGSAVGQDFVHLASGAVSPVLRGLIDRAFRGEAAEATIAVEGDNPLLDRPQRLRLRCLPPEKPGSQTSATVVIVVEDVTAEVQEREQLAGAADTGRANLEHVTDQLRAVGARNEELLSFNRELAIVNADLGAANEELQITAEEAQASTEEVETLNEELQATNEELETLNEELHATIEELNATTEDMDARDRDLRETALMLEQQQRLSEVERQRLSTILAHMADGVVVVAPTGEQELANEAYTSMLGGLDLNSDAADYAGRELPSERSPLRLAAAGESFAQGFTLSGEDGKRRWFEAIGAPLGEPGEASGGVVVIRDITDRNLRRLQEEFIAIASHELRTPLAALRGYLQLLARAQGKDGEREADDYVASALVQTTRLDRLVAELLDATRLEHGRMQLATGPIDLRDLVNNVVATAQVLSPDQHIEVKASAGPMIVEADELRFGQALSNVIGNAIQHASESPTIEVRLRRVGNRAVIIVKDQGPGIPSEVTAHAFDRFSEVADRRTAPSAGLGLGLYITRAIIEGHRGRIKLDSKKGSGTTVTISLPLKPSVGKRRGRKSSPISAGASKDPPPRTQ